MFQVEPILWLQAHSSTALTWLLTAFTLLGYAPAYVAAILTLAFGVRLRPGLAVLVTLLVCGLLTEGLKSGLALPRPYSVDARVLAPAVVPGAAPHVSAVSAVTRGGAASFWGLPSPEAVAAVRSLRAQLRLPERPCQRRGGLRSRHGVLLRLAARRHARPGVAARDGPVAHVPRPSLPRGRAGRAGGRLRRLWRRCAARAGIRRRKRWKMAACPYGCGSSSRSAFCSRASCRGSRGSTPRTPDAWRAPPRPAPSCRGVAFRTTRARSRGAAVASPCRRPSCCSPGEPLRCCWPPLAGEHERPAVMLADAVVLLLTLVGGVAIARRHGWYARR